MGHYKAQRLAKEEDEALGYCFIEKEDLDYCLIEDEDLNYSLIMERCTYLKVFLQEVFLFFFFAITTSAD